MEKQDTNTSEAVGPTVEFATTNDGESFEKASALRKTLVLGMALIIFLQIALCVWIFYVSSGCAWNFNMYGWSVANGIQRCVTPGGASAATAAPVSEGSEATNAQGVVLTETLTEKQREDVASFFSNEVEVQFAPGGALEGVVTPQFVDVTDEAFDFSKYRFILVPVQQERGVGDGVGEEEIQGT